MLKFQHNRVYSFTKLAADETLAVMASQIKGEERKEEIMM